MIPLSILDLCPITEGSTAAQSFKNTVDLAKFAEDRRYHRYWVAEHHSIPGIASAATSIVISLVGAATSRMRIGAGGIMLPNHSPLVIAEQFGTLESLYPGRVDLGLGRAPGSDQVTARALRRNLNTSADEFPQDVEEILDFFNEPIRGQNVHAIPGEGLKVPVWILGSSTFGAALAAEMGLPYSFASHFAPAQMMEAIEIYRKRFKPSTYLEKPYLMMALSTFAAETDEEGELLASSMQQAFVSLRTGFPGKLKAPFPNYEKTLGPIEKSIIDSTMKYSAIGSPSSVKATIEKFIDQTGADELMITSQIFDHEKRKKSYEILSRLMN